MINLLDPEIKLKRQRNKSFKTLTLFFAVLILLSLSVYGTIVYTKSDIDLKMASIASQKEEVNTKILKYKSLEKDLSLTNSKITAAKSIITTRPRWSAILASLASLVPKTVQFANVNISQPAATEKGAATNNLITITGSAKSLEDIEAFRSSLDNSGIFGVSTFKSASFNEEKSNFSYTISTQIIKIDPLAK